jgi:hypothetical protein
MRPVREVPRLTGINLRAFAFVCGLFILSPDTEKGETV